MNGACEERWTQYKDYGTHFTASMSVQACMQKTWGGGSKRNCRHKLRHPSHSTNLYTRMRKRGNKNIIPNCSSNQPETPHTQAHAQAHTSITTAKRKPLDNWTSIHTKFQFSKNHNKPHSGITPSRCMQYYPQPLISHQTSGPWWPVPCFAGCLRLKQITLVNLRG